MKAFAVLPLAVVAASHVYAASSDANDERVVVTATRMAQTTDQALVPVSVLTRDDIERSSATSLPELLSQLPGVDFSNDGGYGKASSIYLRGTSFKHTLVLIDGVRVGSATLGTAPFQDIPVEQIERIELVRGPRSSLYGSEAIGGVIQIFTKKTQSGTTASGSVSLGDHATKGVSANLGIGSESTGLQLNFSNFKTDGIDAQPSGDPDKDGYENTTVGINLNLNPNEKAEVNFSFLRTESENQFDRSPLPFNDYANNLQQTVGGRATVELREDWALSAGAYEHRDESESHFLEYDFGAGGYVEAESKINTKRHGFDLKSDHYLGDHYIVSLGADYQQDQIDSTVAYIGDERDNTGAFLQVQAEYGKIGVLAGFRHDDNQRFGTKNTGNINLGYQLAPEVRAFASYGTAYKAPTFNDLYWPEDDYGAGNPELKPESSKSIEVGVEQKTAKANVAVRMFVTDVDDLIEWACTANCDGDYVTSIPFWQPSNVSSASIKGVELESRFFGDEWSAGLNISLLNPKSSGTGNYLTKRAKRTVQVDVTREFGSLTISANLLAQSARYADAANTAKLPGYGIANIKAGFELDEKWSLEAKVNNLFDRAYETNNGYNSLDRSYLLSLNYQH